MLAAAEEAVGEMQPERREQLLMAEARVQSIPQMLMATLVQLTQAEAVAVRAGRRTTPPVLEGQAVLESLLSAT